MSLALVHLVRAANPTYHLEQFVAAYRAAPPGVQHLFVFACKGFTDHGIVALGPVWRDLPNVILRLPDTGFDLGSYRQACLQIPNEYVCFVNSYARPRVPNWLANLYAVARRPEVGISGATGSFQIDPHVRTNAFCMRRQQYLALVTHDPPNKQAACDLEAGSESLTRRILARGFQARIVGRGNIDVDLRQAQGTRTFRWGRQENLLVADNRTDEYDHGNADWRAFLQRVAWGCTDPASLNR